MDSDETWTDDEYQETSSESEEGSDQEDGVHFVSAGGCGSPGLELTRVSGTDRIDASSKIDSENELVDDSRLKDVDGNGNGNGENGGVHEVGGGKDLVSRRKSKNDDNAGTISLIEAFLSRCKDPESVLEDLKDGFPIREFRERELKEKRKKQRDLEYRGRYSIMSSDKFSMAARCSSLQRESIEERCNSSGPFALPFKKIKDDVDRLKSKGQPLVKWVPAKEQNHCCVPSLVELSMAVLIRNAEFISSLDRIPYVIREKITNLVCDYRKMDINFMRILAAGSPEEISVKDCSWMTIEQFNQIFENCDLKNLRVLRLELCGQFMNDFTLRNAFARSSAKFYDLTVLSIKGAVGLTDEGLSALTQSAPSLKSINLSQCSLVTAHGIHNLAKSYTFTLRELCVDECAMIDAMLMLPALAELKNLEVLSVAGIPTVTDEFVGKIAEVCGLNLKELRLADCRNLTDKSFEVLGAKCPNIISLDLSNLDDLSDHSLQYIAYGCQSINHLRLQRNGFSDEALGDFFEVAGQSLTELSLNCIRKVGRRTALSISICARDLETLDLSWCRNLSDEMVGLIVDSCKSLKLLKLFGCTQITEVFFKGHSNRIVRIVGPNNVRLTDIDGPTKLQ